MESPVDVEIGKTYEVPCVTDIMTFKTVPVLLPAHIDGKKSCLRTAESHYHIDFRFCEQHDFAGNINAWAKKSCSKPFFQNRKAVRDSFNSIDFVGESAFFFVNRWYQSNKKLKLKNRRCPHQGVQVVNSCGTCPAHGLKWNLEKGKLEKFKRPFYLELANGEEPNPENPRGIIRNDKCTIKIKRDLEHDGTVIMVDSNGKRYGKMKQIISSRSYRTRDEINFNTDKICSKKK